MIYFFCCYCELDDNNNFSLLIFYLFCKSLRFYLSVCFKTLIKGALNEKKSVLFFDNLQYKMFKNNIYLPKSFNKKLSQPLFDYKMTFVNSQRENTNSKVNFLLINWFESFVLKISGIQK